MSSKLKNKLDYLHKDGIKKDWTQIDSQKDLSTKEKLEKLVNLGLKRKEKASPTKKKIPKKNLETVSGDFTIKEFDYPLTSEYGKFPLAEWQGVTPEQLAIISGDEECLDVSPGKLLFFDTETTGLAGGTGTIPFMLGFGYFEGDIFKVKIFILNDLGKEDIFLDEVDAFLGAHDFSATVTYNGKGFDFPLMEARYILQRKRFPLLRLPHLDFLFPARTLWKNTYESRKLGHLGELLLGLSRHDDVDGSQIPMMYFNYIRTRSYDIIGRIVDHNALDLVGLAALLLLGIKYLEDITHTADEGEILGTAKLYEKYGHLERAEELYRELKQGAVRSEVVEKSIKSLSIIMKKKKLYDEAAELWETLSQQSDRSSLRELAVHLEHREKNYARAMKFVRQGLENSDLTETQRLDFEKRLKRLNRKVKALEKEDEKP